jgi:hypothetical protein
MPVQGVPPNLYLLAVMDRLAAVPARRAATLAVPVSRRLGTAKKETPGEAPGVEMGSAFSGPLAKERP